MSDATPALPAGQQVSLPGDSDVPVVLEVALLLAKGFGRVSAYGQTNIQNLRPDERQHYPLILPLKATSLPKRQNDIGTPQGAHMTSAGPLAETMRVSESAFAGPREGNRFGPNRLTSHIVASVGVMERRHHD